LSELEKSCTKLTEPGTALIDGGVDLNPAPKGCGCSGTPAGFGALALLWLLKRGRSFGQAASNCRTTTTALAPT
jgi:hypothetical protein